jgi:hypothetical protein
MSGERVKTQSEQRTEACSRDVVGDAPRVGTATRNRAASKRPNDEFASRTEGLNVGDRLETHGVISSQ